MKNRQIMKMILAILLTIVLSVSMAACGNQEQQIESAETESSVTMDSELNHTEMDSLMSQVAESEIQKRYEAYVPDEAFANAEVFGIDRNENEGIAYVLLNTAEYAAVKGKAYLMGGSSGEAIIHFEYTEDGTKLTKIDWSADGNIHDDWIKENFPKEYLKKHDSYEAFDENGKNKLGTELIKKVEQVMGVPVETENLLNIDLDQGTYEIIKTTETGEPGEDYQFNTEVIDQGSLSQIDND